MWPDTGTNGKPRISRNRVWEPEEYSREDDVINPWGDDPPECLFITNDLAIRLYWETFEASKRTNRALISTALLHILFKACLGVYHKHKDTLHIDETCMKLFELSFRQIFLVQQAECDLIKFLEFYYLLRDVLMMVVLIEIGASKEMGAAGVQELLRTEKGDVLRTKRICELFADVNILEMLHTGIRAMHAPAILSGLLDAGALLFSSGGYPKYQQAIVSDIVRMLRMPRALFKMWAERALVCKYKATGDVASLVTDTVWEYLLNVGGVTKDETIETLNRHIIEAGPRTDEEMQMAVEMYNALYAADCALRGGTHRIFFRRKYGRGHPAFAGKRLALFARLQTLGFGGGLKVMLKTPADQVAMGNQADRPFAVGQACLGWRAEQRKYVCLKREEPRVPASKGPISAQQILCTYKKKNGRKLVVSGPDRVKWESPY